MLKDLLLFCGEKYNKQQCNNCKKNECSNINCEKCLYNIHFNKVNRDYDCENMIYYYVLKNTAKYACEISYLLNVKNELFNKELNIWSIGTGPCYELFAFEVFCSTNKLNYNFIGFDLNNNWKIIHNKIQVLLPNRKINFIYSDFFEYYNHFKDRPNVIILNYVLSSILASKNDINEFLKSICTLFNNIDSGILIINDINSGKDSTNARYYFDKLNLGDLLSQEGISSNKYHFKDSNKSYYTYGTSHINSKVNWTSDEINELIGKYNYNI